jgi:hypothetical protein
MLVAVAVVIKVRLLAVLGELAVAEMALILQEMLGLEVLIAVAEVAALVVVQNLVAQADQVSLY